MVPCERNCQKKNEKKKRKSGDMVNRCLPQNTALICVTIYERKKVIKKDGARMASE